MVAEWTWLILSGALGVLVVPGTLYLLLLTLAGLCRPVRAEAESPFMGRFAIIIPAHDEAAGIARTVDNLLAIARADGAADVYVIADNCSDDTAVIARARGAQVLERNDLSRQGKGYALDHAFRALATEGFAAFVVIDADTLADDNLLEVLRLHFSSGASVVQTRYLALNGGIAKVADLALCAFNVLRPRGRHVLGWSSGILGNGFALRLEVIRQVPYTATSLVEDLEYHLCLIEHGFRVHFADETSVRGEMPLAVSGQKTQRSRWEGGRMRMLLEHGGKLARRVCAGQAVYLEPLLDLLLLPLAYHSILLLVLLILPVPLARLLGMIGLAVLVLHVIAAAHVGGLSGRQLTCVLLKVPRFILWKLTVVASIIRSSRATTRWVRTERDAAHEET